MVSGAKSTASPKVRAKGTLGDVLLAGKAARPPEKFWVDVVRSIASGDQGALRVLFAQANRLVFTLLLRKVGSRESAEELTVDVFHDIWRRASTYDPDSGSVLAWIMNQARSRAIDRMRHDRRRKRAGTLAGRRMLSSVGLLEAIEAREAGGLLKSALERLTPEERQAIEASFFSQLTHRETADKLNVPIGTVKTRIRSGLTKIRKSLAKAGGGR